MGTFNNTFNRSFNQIVSNVNQTVPTQPSEITGTQLPPVLTVKTYSVASVADVSYAWSVPAGWAILSGQGTNEVSVKVGYRNGTISVTPSNEIGNGTARTLAVFSVANFAYTPVTEDRARVANFDYSAIYSGTTYYVDAAAADDTGNGLTLGTAKKTVTAAYALCSAGDIISCVAGIYLMSAESGVWGYLMFNAAEKDVLVKSNSGLLDVVFDQPTTGGYCVRKHATVSMTFKNIIMQTALNITTFMETTVGDNSRTIFDNCSLINTYEGPLAACYSTTDVDTLTKWIEFKGCSIISSGTSSTPVAMALRGTGVTYIYTNTLIKGNKKRVIASANTMKGQEIYYDCKFEASANDYIAIFGNDAATFTNNHGLIDIRGCTAEYLDGAYGHAFLFGRGTSDVYCVNNKAICNNTSNATNIGFVIKTVATTQANAVFKGNWATSARPFLLKGAVNCDVQFNSFICNDSVYYPFAVTNDNQEVECNCSGNKVENNSFYAPDLVISLLSNTTVTAKTSALTFTIDFNKYEINSGYYLNDVSGILAWADKATFWGNDFDLNSSYTTGVSQPVQFTFETR